MKINVGITLNDEERDLFANYVDGKDSARLATRKDVNSFVMGCMDAALEKQEAIDMYDVELDVEAEIKQLRASGHNDSYIRGWMLVGERVKTNG